MGGGLFKKSPIKCSTCKTRQGVNLKGNPFKCFSPASIFQRNTFKNFFYFIFFQGKSLVKFFQKILLNPFFKNSLQEGVFKNSLKFLQLVQNLTPIRKLLCTFLY